jgi:hypothetical protein
MLSANTGIKVAYGMPMRLTAPMRRSSARIGGVVRANRNPSAILCSADSSLHFRITGCNFISSNPAITAM